MSRVYMNTKQKIGVEHGDRFFWFRAVAKEVIVCGILDNGFTINPSQARKLAAKLNKWADQIEKGKEKAK